MSVNDDDRQFVAEYVLGTLPGALRLMIASRIADEADITEVARMWEQRLAPLHELAVAIAPPDDLWPELARSFAPPPIPRDEPEEGGKDGKADGKGKDAKGKSAKDQNATGKEPKGKVGLPAKTEAFSVPSKVDDDEEAPKLAAPLGDEAPGLQRRAKLWRWTAILLGIGLVGTGGTLAYREWHQGQDLHYLASLQAERAASVLVRIGVRDGDILVRPMLDPAPEGKTYQLWLVPDGQSARSLGTFTGAFATRNDLIRRLGAAGAARAMLQVTLEPAGGSDVMPLGEVLYSGRLLPE
ncbi:anti-sigma factor domain-containing protein [Xanthobacteraceae bacterium A53D]